MSNSLKHIKRPEVATELRPGLGQLPLLATYENKHEALLLAEVLDSEAIPGDHHRKDTKRYRGIYLDSDDEFATINKFDNWYGISPAYPGWSYTSITEEEVVILLLKTQYHE